MTIPNVDVRNLPVTLHVGKNGITQTLVEELARQLEKRRFVKVKLLRSFMDLNDRKESAKELADKTHSILVDVTGGMLIFYKPKSERKSAKAESKPMHASSWSGTKPL